MTDRPDLPVLTDVLGEPGEVIDLPAAFVLTGYSPQVLRSAIARGALRAWRTDRGVRGRVVVLRRELLDLFGTADKEARTDA